MIELVISGGQCGADRGGLDAAVLLGIPHGGWCPKGRRASDGVIPKHYKLQETGSESYATRTRKNVQDSHATIVFAPVPASGGSKLTLEICASLRRPSLHVCINEAANDPDDVCVVIADWLDRYKPRVLNVAGSRDAPRFDSIQVAVAGIMAKVLRGRSKR